MRSGLFRDEEQIQEAEVRPKVSRAGTLLLAALGSACIVFAVVTHARQKAAPPARTFDPLSELAAQAKAPLPGQGAELGGADVTFPSMLSDEGRTTTALAVVRASVPANKAGDTASPPPPTDRLAVVPLPAKSIVGSSPVASRPRDALTQLAKEASSVTTPPVEEGRAGGYQLQTSSFRSEEEAGLFAIALRRRGHRAYVEPAQVFGRGSWYRVRVGPFRSKIEAASYRAEFEKREHLVPFLVEPPKDKGPSKSGEQQPLKAR